MATFTLVDDADGKFVIDGNIIKTAALLDYETATTHNITVAVSGAGVTVSNKQFTIDVIDNAVATIVLSNSTMAEDITAGTIIGELTVLEGTGTYTFTIISDPDNLFTIDGEDTDRTGSVDYETATSHEVTIQADNGAGDVITQTLTITVSDVSDTVTPETYPPGIAGQAVFGRGVYVSSTAVARQYAIEAGLYMNEVA